MGASGLNKRATLTLDKSSKPNQTRAKGSAPEKNTTNNKELLPLTQGIVAEGR
jgi:hypothetical protein